MAINCYGLGMERLNNWMNGMKNEDINSKTNNNNTMLIESASWM